MKYDPKEMKKYEEHVRKSIGFAVRHGHGVCVSPAWLAAVMAERDLAEQEYAEIRFARLMDQNANNGT